MAKNVAVINLDRRNRLVIYKKFKFSQPQFSVISQRRTLLLLWKKSNVAADEINSIGGLQYYTFKSLEEAQGFANKIKSEY
jgi:hypothetical protein